MLIIKHRAELPTLIQSLKTLPIEGKSFDELVSREYLRQVAISKLEKNAAPPIPVHNTDTPTTVIDNYWGMRLGITVG